MLHSFRIMVLFLSVVASHSQQEETPFIWGTATAAYQVEGSRHADGRTPSIWDAFDTKGVSDLILATNPSGNCNIHACENASKADDDYVRFEESVAMTEEYGFSAARMSISMSRVMTYTFENESLSFVPNDAGISHYKKVFSAYKKKGVRVACTLFHWDLPLAIEEAAAAASSGCYGGSAWLCHDIVARAFSDYAFLAMTHFAEDVTWWITLNEPLTVIANGYAGSGAHAPGRCSDRSKCFAGDDHTEPYIAAKGLILAHAHAFRAWERAGKPGQGCGMTLNGDYRIPYDKESADDVEAATRSMEWQAPLFADPVIFGRWPIAIDNAVGSRLESLGWAWSADELSLVHGAHDGHFFMNTYTTGYARVAQDGGCGYFCDSRSEVSGYDFKTGVPIGTPSSNGWLFNYGPGIGKLMSFYNDRYPGMRYIVTENGWGNATAPTMEEDVHDMERCNFYRDYIGNMSLYAVDNEIAVDAYFAWSLMDNYEWADGFSTRFGLTYVNYETEERTPKLSARWFEKYVTTMPSLPTDRLPLPACDENSLLS